jgi:hypothetical protein
VFEKVERRRTIGKQALFAWEPGIAAIAAVFGEHHPVAVAGEPAQALAAIADMATIAVQIEDHRPPEPRRQIPGKKIEAVRSGQRDFAYADCRQIGERRPRPARPIKQPALKHEEAGHHPAIGEGCTSKNRINHPTASQPSRFAQRGNA